MIRSLAALVLVATSFTGAYADDPMPVEEPAPASEPAPAVEGPVTSPIETPVAPPADAPKEAPPRRARMMDSAPRSVSPRVRDDGERRLDKTEDEVAGGRHWRIKTAQGAVHVWVPPGYDRATAGTVFYVHGYWTDADGAWREHQLARQFKASRQNAMFVVPDAPSSNEESVQWPALTDLRKAVTRANIKLPDGPVVVMGHSGAFRTIMQWVDHRAVDKIILLDAMYAGEAAFDQFIDSGKRADHHRLIVIASNTAAGSRSFAKRYRFAVTRDNLPDSAGGFTRRERSAKLLYVRSQYEHMSIVTSKKVIPMLLRVTSLKAL